MENEDSNDNIDAMIRDLKKNQKIPDELASKILAPSKEFDPFQFVAKPQPIDLNKQKNKIFENKPKVAKPPKQLLEPSPPNPPNQKTIDEFFGIAPTIQSEKNLEANASKIKRIPLKRTKSQVAKAQESMKIFTNMKFCFIPYDLYLTKKQVDVLTKIIIKHGGFIVPLSMLSSQEPNDIYILTTNKIPSYEVEFEYFFKFILEDFS